MRLTEGSFDIVNSDVTCRFVGSGECRGSSLERRAESKKRLHSSPLLEFWVCVAGDDRPDLAAHSAAFSLSLARSLSLSL